MLHPADVEQANPVTAEEVEVLKQELEGLRQELLNVGVTDFTFYLNFLVYDYLVFLMRWSVGNSSHPFLTHAQRV